MKGKPTRKKDSSRPGRTRAQARELAALAALPDHRIDTGDVTEVRDWTGAKRGLLYRPLKRQLTLRLDADVVAWFKRRAKGGRGYQTDINRALRDYVRRRDKRAVG
ncbi:MAG: BrnA antitoxin family protein [Rhodospirillales bacterium]